MAEPVWLVRVVRGRPRLFIALVVGLVALALLPARLPPVMHGILAWDIGVTAYLLLVAQLFLSERISDMAYDAARQEEGEWTIFWLTLAGTVASFGAIFSAFAGVSQMPPGERSLHVALVAYTLLASWLMTHTTFGLRYAHEYYSVSAGRTQVDGGLDFPSESNPDYFDFFYFAIVIGMTFQVSDVQITSRKFRRLATLHGLLGFLYNTVILALTVNIAASLL
jgi:uncharacterized membrane protein